MRKFLLGGLMVATVLPGVALAQSRDDRRDDRRYEHRARCHRSDGTTGTIIGAGGGALAGSALGGGTAGTLIGGVGGALLGRHIDKKKTICR